MNGAEGVEVHLLDVGQGDCTLIIDRASNTALLVDCPPKGINVVREILGSVGNPEVVGAIITHWDLDHYGGMLEVTLACGCQSLYYNLESLTSYPVDKTIRRAALRQIISEPYRSMLHRPAHEGVHGALGDFEWELLAPSQLSLAEAAVNFDRNLASGILRGEAFGHRIIIGGDAHGRVWRRLIEEGIDLRADVFRWPHHGAAMRHVGGATPEELLDSVRPRFVIMSVGTRNRYGHPDRENVELAARQARVGCTEVTPKCHSSLPNRRRVGCGETMSFSLTRNNSIEAFGGWDGHDDIVNSWDRPMCRVRPA